MQPVTMTLPFSAIACPIAPSDSRLALSRKPQVLTMTRSAPSCLRASSYPSARRRVMMRSESTRALGHPSETKLTLGGAAFCITNLSDYGAGTNPDYAQLQGFARASCVLSRLLPECE